ncbi:MAG: toxin TcdB middle/N-terminal domain-containing protein, partial [Lysobacter sp.]
HLNNTSSHTPPGAVGLAVIVGTLFLLQIGAVIQHVVAAPSMSGPGQTSLLFEPDPDSDRVAATAADFRVDESGAATYSIPLFAAPGTAGVAPKLSLNYSSQGGNGPLGKGWSIGGLSSIARCRATREAGDFIENGQPVDGSPAPVNFTASDRFCLDGQRLLPHSGSGACPSAGGMTGIGYRTEIESFQRVCAYAVDAAGPKFFTVERKDGSISWYGDRDNSASANRDDGYVNSTAPGKEASALMWAQTRFQDSTGNYIDYLYTEGNGEHRLDKVRYTGKTVLPGQTGSALSPYAEIRFNHSTYFSTTAYVSGGMTRMTQRLDSITSSVDHDYNGSYNDVRHYSLAYGFGSAATILTSVQECSDSTRQICANATTFGWSQTAAISRNLFETQENTGSIPNGTLAKFEGLKFGDIDGDGRQDMVWMKDGASGDSCPTESVYVAFGRMDANGSPYLTVGAPVMCTPAELAWTPQEASWFLLDYDGDGREDIFLRGNAYWVGYRATGDVAQPFATSTNLLAELAQPIPSGTSKEGEPQLADINGDGLIDLVYPQSTGLVVRVMERGGSYGFRWGGARAVTLLDAAGTNYVVNGLYRKNNYQQLNDFNADARSDLMVNVGSGCSSGGGGGGPGPGPGPGDPPINPQIATPSNPDDGTTSSTANEMTATSTSGCAFPFVIEQTTSGAVTARRYGTGQFSPNEAMSFADINGDGLSDYILHGLSTGIPGYGLNTGAGFVSAGNLGFGVNTSQLQVVDANGDGRADVVYPSGNAQHFVVRYGMANGEFAAALDMPNTLTQCTESQCLPTRSYLFGDFDGDGNPDYMRVKWDTYSPVFYSRGGPANRFIPRDVITRVTDGLGAQTDIVYAPLTNKDVYRPGTGTRNSAIWGRGSPVQDLLAPMYVVARASSSSPQAGAPNARATVHYRYTGARLQAGGRGFLGFAYIDTIDANQSGGFVVTRTGYHQNFPFTGLPYLTTKAVKAGEVYAIPACLAGPVTDSCFAPAGAALPGFGGSWFSISNQVWQADREGGGGFNPALQQALFPSTSGTEETLRDPFTGAQTSR